MGRKGFVVLIIGLLWISSVATLIGSDGPAGERGPGPLDSSEGWTDSFDDMSHVYVPDGGLVNVEVIGGEVRLATGQLEGWIASSVITPPLGMRCDLLILDVIQPGNSSFEVSLLNASEESSLVGYANETIPGYIKREGTELSIQNVSPLEYPLVRVQVNLNADGSNRPRLLGWSLYFARIDEWREDFRGTGKMVKFRGINVSNNNVFIDTSEAARGIGYYTPYPPVVFSHPHHLPYFDVFYPNADETGYKDKEQISTTGTRGLAFDDLNGDGILDLACANHMGGSNPADSEILWGTSNGKWSASGSTKLNTKFGYEVASGDLDGDNNADLVFSPWHPNPGAKEICIFLNKGSGEFNYDPDIKLSHDDNFHGVDVGDLNDDGYDDIVIVEDSFGSALCFFGGPSGPDSTVDIKLPIGDGGSNNGDVRIKDIDLDGNNDVIIATSIGGKTPIYLGDDDGPDTIADFNLMTADPVRACEAGDINGDGFIDIVYAGADIQIFKGGADGWSDDRTHHISLGTSIWQLGVVDIDKDGFDDILKGSWDGKFRVFLGGTTWPSSPDIEKTGLSGNVKDMAVAVPKSGNKGTWLGHFTTEPIVRPPNKKWDLCVLDGIVYNNTEIRISILNPQNRIISGYRDLSDRNIDLSPLDVSTIRLRVSLFTESNNTTPSINGIIVNWQDQMTWREQFYGRVKTDRILGCSIEENKLDRDAFTWSSPQLAISSLRSDSGFDTGSMAFLSSEGLDYTSRQPVHFDTTGVSAIEVKDVNDDGFPDIAFSVSQLSDVRFQSKSALFLGTAPGWRKVPDHTFPTVGAMDVLVEDLNNDGRYDVVFAQEQDNGDYIINSTLFWGTQNGWNSTPDVEFSTSGASEVEAVDIDDDGLLDLVFACYKRTSTSTNSMVFLQSSSGFDGVSPSYNLSTTGARAVAAGDIDSDGHMDLVFANSFSAGLVEIDSRIYWGKQGGGFDTAYRDLPTMGATDVKLADLDGDSDMDIIFANHMDNDGDRNIESYAYLNDGSRSFGPTPDVLIPTTGAVAVDIGDIDGAGWLDLVFACQFNGTSYSVPSLVYLGGNSGWSHTPDLKIPTVGASDVIVAQLARVGYGGYMSKPITPDPDDDPGEYHTFRYTAYLGPSQRATIQLVDAITLEVLTETSMTSGTNEWSLKELRYKDHPSIRVIISAEGLDLSGTFEIDDLWLNWTERIMAAPQIVSLSVDQPSVFRTGKAVISVQVMDEYDLPGELTMFVDYRLNGTTGWADSLLSSGTFKDGLWTFEIVPRVDTKVGMFDFRVTARDTDMLGSIEVVYPNMIEVLNNIPTTPRINLVPARPDTTHRLGVEIIQGSHDVEGTGLTYHYLWYLDGELQPFLVTDSINPSLTTKGHNWSVEVRASDGDDIGPAATAWRVIQNAAPRIGLDLPDPDFPEDTVDSDWLDLSTAFDDPDNDTLTWTVKTPPDHITVEIDPVTGKVTLIPEENWNGQETINFIATDGENTANQTVTVYVTEVNDIPMFATVNGNPVGDGPVEITVKQDELLSIDVLVIDPEGDELVFDINTSRFQVDGFTGSITWQPDNDQVGTMHFGLIVWEVASPSERVTLDFIITVENVNDPMGDPRITQPSDGASFEEDIQFSLIAVCTDPDLQHGQVLNFSWSSNMTGHMGYGPSLSVALSEVGNHVITLTVTDGDHQKMTTLNVIITAKPDGPPPPPPNGGGGDEEPFNYTLVLGLVIAFVIIGVVFFVARNRRVTEEPEVDDLRTTPYMIETEQDSTEEAAVTQPPEPEEILMEVQGEDLPEGLVTMQAQETEAASAQTLALFGEAEAAEPVLSEEEAEQLRLDNVKRNYQNAIGRLPYGIPSPELKDMDWVVLAAALATGEKRTTSSGLEITNIDGRWYYSDADDTGTFLKEHGSKPKEDKAEQAGDAPVDKAAMLAKLEERFILGEISEENYHKLVKKYDGDDD